MSDSNPTINPSTHLIVIPNREEIARFMSKVKINPESGCWEWQCGLGSAGYGSFSYHGKYIKAHRWVYAWLYGPLQRGKGHGIPEIDHLCRNRGCVSPCHLELVPARVNVLRGECPPAKNASKTHCFKGHELTPENTLVGKIDNGRRCKTCASTRSAGWRARNPEANARRKAYFQEYYRRKRTA